VVEEGEEGNGKKRGRRKDFGEILPPVVLVLCAPPIFLVGVLRYGIHMLYGVFILVVSYRASWASCGYGLLRQTAHCSWALFRLLCAGPWDCPV
jgi:hypothetical protein